MALVLSNSGRFHFEECRWTNRIILYLKAGNKACGGRLEYYAKIGDLEEELAGQFYRIHRGYLINLFHVEGYVPSIRSFLSADRRADIRNGGLKWALTE
jgi:hypothetical protein|nr:LytTR family DNA-binding domain-containing protein [uncultured Acetatifactor sp.]